MNAQLYYERRKYPEQREWTALTSAEQALWQEVVDQVCEVVGVGVLRVRATEAEADARILAAKLHQYSARAGLADRLAALAKTLVAVADGEREGYHADDPFILIASDLATVLAEYDVAAEPNISSRPETWPTVPDGEIPI